MTNPFQVPNVNPVNFERKVERQRNYVEQLCNLVDLLKDEVKEGNLSNKDCIKQRIEIFKLEEQIETHNKYIDAEIEHYKRSLKNV